MRLRGVYRHLVAAAAVLVSTFNEQAISTRVLKTSLFREVYDHLITLDDEVSLVWPVKWSLGKVLFMLARYPPYIDTVLSLMRWYFFHLFSAVLILLS